jgi:7-cyano-7-deazaguanine synthase
MRLLLFSGGIDSSALAAWKKPDLLLTIDYGQRPANGEIAAATAIASELGIDHAILRADLSNLGTGPLTGKPASTIGKAPEWWPYRNQMLITLAGIRFVPEGLREIMIGAVSTDVHADGKPRFIKRMNAVMKGQEGRVKVTAPAISLTAGQLLKRSKLPTELLGLTFSCHMMEYACGQCRGCEKHSAVIRKFVSNIS